jgi:hypothetical protein
LAGRAVHGGLGCLFVTVCLGSKTDPGLVAFFSERNLFFVVQMKDIVAEPVSRRIVPVADGCVTETE